MRRGSLVPPLLLIGFGVVFLARNLMPDLPLVDYLAQYWPWLLVAWGGMRLVEILVWAMTGKPLPRFGVSGGEWALVIFLCLFGFSLHAARGFSDWLPRNGFEWGGLQVFGESFDYPISAETAAPAAPHIVVENLDGNTRISGGDVQMVSVNGRNTIRSVRREDADRANQESKLEVTASGDQIVIRTNQDRGRRRERVSSELNITVPRGATIEARGRRGDFDINDVNGRVEIESQNSSVRLENIGGPVRLDVRSSSIVRALNLSDTFELSGNGDDIDLEKIAGEVKVDGSYGGIIQMRALAKPLNWDGLQTDITAAAVPGELRLTLSDLYANGLTGPVRIDSQSKDLRLGGFTGPMDISVVRGDLLLLPALAMGRMSVRLNSGNVELGIQPGTKFNIQAVVDRGSAVNNFGSEITAEQGFNRRNGVMRGGITGSGAAEVEIHVDRGEIRVRKADKGEMLPFPSRTGDDLDFPEAPEAPLPPEAPEPPAPPAPPRVLKQ